jgi:uncharacterized protein (DUF2237 family)
MWKLILTLSSVARSIHAENDYRNVNGDPLQPCSSDGMALTGRTRTGYCVDQNENKGSHHICIDLASADGGNFCTVTGQYDWCSSYKPCDGNQKDGTCPIENWCVCQWAFASYIENAGGCDMIQDIVCESINLEAVLAYRKAWGSKYKMALNCLVNRCGLDLSKSYMQAKPAVSAWFLVSLVVPFIAFIVCKVMKYPVYKVVKYPSEGNGPIRDTLLKNTFDKELKPGVWSRSNETQFLSVHAI